MDAAEIGVLVGGVTLIVATLWFFFGGRRAQNQAAPKGRYACPMHPWITSDDAAATCSVCGMKLVARG
jgi:hypothetical protein